MKNTIATLGALFSVALTCLAQDSPIGNYSMSEWAHYQLNVNRSLERGAAGQIIGYTGNGVVGLLSVAAGSDTNAVAAVADLATLTNTIAGYTKAIVGAPGETTQKLFQLIPLPNQITNTSQMIPWSGGSIVDNGDGSFTASRPTGSGVGFIFPGLATVGQRYTAQITAKSTSASTMEVRSSSSAASNYVALTSDVLGTGYVVYRGSFTASTVDALGANRPFASPYTNTLTIRDIYWSQGEGILAPDGVTIFASVAMPGYAWQQVYLESDGGGGGGRVVVNYQPGGDPSTVVVPSNADTVIVDIVSYGTGNDVSLATTPVIAAGSYVGQQIFLQSHQNNLSQFSIGDYRSFPGSGVRLTTGTTVLVGPSECVWFYWNGTYWWQVANKQGTTLEAQLLPMPWSEPGTNGVQTLSPQVKEALAIEMLPYILDNWQRLMPKALSNAAPTAIIVP
jgi:hypothetical protein